LQYVDTLYILMSMTTKLKKWGNSYGVRVAKSEARKLGIKEGSPIKFNIEPVVKKRKYTLEELVAQINPKNRHPLIDWGPDVGNEIVEWEE